MAGRVGTVVRHDRLTQRLFFLFPWLVALVCLVWVGWSQPAASDLSFSNNEFWRQGFHDYEQSNGQPFRWSSAEAELTIPASTTGTNRLLLRLQSGRGEAVPVTFQLGSSQLAIEVAQQPRVYRLLVQGKTDLNPIQISFQVPPFQAPNDPRVLGVVFSGVQVVPLAGGWPWWLVTALLLLAQLAIVVTLLSSHQRLLEYMLIAGLWMPALVLWLGASIYNTDGVAQMHVLLYGVTALLVVNRLLQTVPRVSDAPQSLTVVRWDRRITLVAMCLVSVATGSRLLYMADMTRFWNSDDYLTGVFALNILHGDTPLYYDGRTGTVSAYLAAPLLALFGTSSETLALVPLLLSALLTLALYGLGRDLFGVWGGLAAAAWWAVPSHPVLFWSLKPQPGYLEMLAFGTLMLWGGVRLLWGDGTTIQKLLLATLTGIAAALALWSNLLALSFVLAGGIFGLLAWQRLLRLPRWCYLALVVPPLLIWLGPLLYLYQIHPNLTPLGWLNDDINRNPGAQTALQGFLTRQLPLLLTGRVLSITQLNLMQGAAQPDFWLAIVVTVALTMCSVMVLLALYAGLLQIKRAHLLPLFLAIATVSLFIFSSMGWLVSDVRYVLPVLVALSLLVGSTIAIARSWRYGRAIAAAMLLGVVSFNTLTLVGAATPALQAPPRPYAQAAAYLEQQGVRYIYGSFWTSWPVMFESGNTIIASTVTGATKVNYDTRNEQQVAAAQGQATAFVMEHGRASLPAFEQFITTHSMSCTRQEFQMLVIFTNCTPFPNIDALVPTMPMGE